MTRASGPFDVTVTPLPPDPAIDAAFSRLSFDKRFHGDLEATSRGIMLASGGPHAGVGGYVALERVVGTLHGRRGSFILQHSGTMTAERTEIDVKIVPGSGEGELAGISGTLVIHMRGAEHSYDLDYSLGG